MELTFEFKNIFQVEICIQNISHHVMSKLLDERMSSHFADEQEYETSKQLYHAINSYICDCIRRVGRSNIRTLFCCFIFKKEAFQAVLPMICWINMFVIKQICFFFSWDFRPF